MARARTISRVISRVGPSVGDDGCDDGRCISSGWCISRVGEAEAACRAVPKSAGGGCILLFCDERPEPWCPPGLCGVYAGAWTTGRPELPPLCVCGSPRAERGFLGGEAAVPPPSRSGLVPADPGRAGANLVVSIMVLGRAVYARGAMDQTREACAGAFLTTRLLRKASTVAELSGLLLRACRATDDQ